MSDPALGFVRITSVAPKGSILARLSDERPNVEQGYGGWTEVTRPWRPPITTYQAPPALHLTLPILLDGFTRNDSVEDDIQKLEAMARPPAAHREPPQVKIAARGGAVPYTGRTWVIDTLAWGDALMNSEGDRVRQQVTLSLIEYVADLYLTEKSAAKRQLSKADAKKTQRGANEKRVTVKRSSKVISGARRSRSSGDDFGTGEDLLSIAARELGDADRWVEIAELNGMRDPRSLVPGQVIRLP